MKPDDNGTWVNEIKHKILPNVGIKELRSVLLFDLKEIEFKLLNTLEEKLRSCCIM